MVEVTERALALFERYVTVLEQRLEIDRAYAEHRKEMDRLQAKLQASVADLREKVKAELEAEQQCG